MTDRESKLLDQIFNPYNEQVKQAEPTDVDAHWEVIESIIVSAIVERL